MDGESKMEQYFFTVSTLIPENFFSLETTLLVKPGRLSFGTSTFTYHHVIPPRIGGLIPPILLHTSESLCLARTQLNPLKREKIPKRSNPTNMYFDLTSSAAAPAPASARTYPLWK